VNQANNNGATPLFMAAQVCITNISAQISKNLSVLILWLQEGHAAIVQTLIKAGGDINTARNDGATPLFMASQVTIVMDSRWTNKCDSICCCRTATFLLYVYCCKPEQTEASVGKALTHHTKLQNSKDMQRLYICLKQCKNFVFIELHPGVICLPFPFALHIYRRGSEPFQSHTADGHLVTIQSSIGGTRSSRNTVSSKHCAFPNKYRRLHP
jgi:hypothetical protein